MCKLSNVKSFTAIQQEWKFVQRCLANPTAFVDQFGTSPDRIKVSDEGLQAAKDLLKDLDQAKCEKSGKACSSFYIWVSQGCTWQ